MAVGGNIKGPLLGAGLGAGAFAAVVAIFALMGRTSAPGIALAVTFLAFLVSFLVWGLDVRFDFGPERFRAASSYLIAASCVVVASMALWQVSGG